MKVKKGVEAVIYSEKNGTKYFLVMHRILNWTGWEFVKGGQDEDSPEDAIMREIREETNLKTFEIVKKLPSKKVWEAGDTHYDYFVFLVKADSNERIGLDQEIMEHDDFKWATKDQVMKLLTHKNSRDVFEEALKELE